MIPFVSLPVIKLDEYKCNFGSETVAVSPLGKKMVFDFDWLTPSSNSALLAIRNLEKLQLSSPGSATV